MSRSVRPVNGVWLVAIPGLLFAVPAPAHAQWYLAGFIGASHTQNSTVSLREGPGGLALDFHDVRFYSLSWSPRRYYGFRLGHIGGERRRFGLEVEMIHLKAIADTSRDYRVTTANGTSLPAGGGVPMNSVVQEYQMTHGLNLALLNLVLRRRIGSARGGQVAALVRVGAGPTFPHGETTVNHAAVHRYQRGGLGVQGAAGLEVDLPFRGLAFVEYKLTRAHPTIEAAQGTASSPALSHHISFGVGIALTRR